MNELADRETHPTTDCPSNVQEVPITALRAGDSPRLSGENRAHIARLTETDGPLPPILIDRRTMRVIDGTHRVMAAALQGRETISASFFDGSEADVFLRAVEENIAHGLPLTRADRQAAAERIIGTHPQMSDRAIGRATGLAAKTITAIRKRLGTAPSQSTSRVGRDGKVRPLDSSDARRRAAELLSDEPQRSLRDVARAAGISPATVLDVRRRLERGEPPVPERSSGRGGAVIALEPPADAPLQGPHQAPEILGARSAGSVGPASSASSTGSASSTSSANAISTVRLLLRDPSLRNNEQGKGVLRLLHVNAASEPHLLDTVGAVPPHCLAIFVQLARHYAWMWQGFADELDGRARIIGPR